jgi:hypothetical protein
MSATATRNSRTVPGADTLQTIDFALDNSYPNPAGYPLTPGSFGLTLLRRITECRARNVASAIYTPVLNITSANGVITAAALQLVVATTGVQVANAVDVSAASFHIVGEGD